MMSDLGSQENTKLVKRINATLPDSLAAFVSTKVGPDGLYETPSEYIRDLIRHDMESYYKQEKPDFYQTIFQSMNSPTSEMKKNFFDEKRKKLQKMQ